jgi:hypothetical protein
MQAKAHDHGQQKGCDAVVEYCHPHTASIMQLHQKDAATPLLSNHNIHQDTHNASTAAAPAKVM